MDTDDILARLTFNALATRTFFTDRTNGVRLRIEAGVVAFRPVAARRGVDVLMIERRTRGAVTDVARDALTRRLMHRLFKAGLSQTQPYFRLEDASPRGWFSLDHHDAENPPQRQPFIVVSDFDPPPVAIDMGLWRRLDRAIDSTVPAPLWQDFMVMFHSAVRMTERITRGRKSNERLQAEKLLTTIERSGAELQALAKRQPEFADDIASLLFSVTGESVTDNTDTVIEYQRPANPRPKISRQFVEQVLAESETTKPPRRRRRKWPEASVADVRAIAQQMEESGPESESEVISSSQVDTETTDDTTDVEVQPVKSQRRSRRKWPEASAEDIRAAAAELMDFEETKPEHFVAEAFITAETNTDSADTDQSEVDEEVASPDDSDTMEEAPLAAKAFEPEADPEEPEDIPVESETEQPGVDHEPTDLTDDHEPADQIDDIAQQHQPTQDEVEDEQQKSRDEWWRKQRGEE